MKKIVLIMLICIYILIFNVSVKKLKAETEQEKYQILSLSVAQSNSCNYYSPGDIVELSVLYDVSDGNKNVSSIGAKILFNEKELKYLENSYIFPNYKLFDPSLQDNLDENDENEKIIVFAFAGLENNFPGDSYMCYENEQLKICNVNLPLILCTFRFQILSDKPAKLKISKTSNDIAYGFIGDEIVFNKTYQISSSFENSGYIAPQGTIDVTCGKNQSFNIIPDDNSFIEDIIVDGISIGASNSYTFFNIQSDHEIHAIFSESISEKETYTITANSNQGGKITPDNLITAVENQNQIFYFQPDKCNKIKDVIVDNVSIGPVMEYEFINITQNHNINVVYEPLEYIVSIKSHENGLVIPDGEISLSCGKSYSWLIMPDSCYKVKEILINYEKAEIYDFSKIEINDINQDYEIDVFFEKINIKPQIENIIPDQSPKKGGIIVEITGENFCADNNCDNTELFIENNKINDILEISDNNITFISPQHDIGEYLLTVSNPCSVSAYINYNYINLSPAISDIQDMTVLEDSKSLAIKFSISEIDGDDMYIDIESDDEVIEKNKIKICYDNECKNNFPFLLLSNSEYIRNLTFFFTPEENLSYVKDFIISVSDTITSVSESFRITVLEVNDPPSLDVKDEIIILEDNGLQKINDWMIYKSTGADNEFNQSIEFFVKVDNDLLFQTKPEINKNLELVFNTAKDISGQAKIEIYIKDDGGILNGGNDTSETKIINLKILAVNDCPYFEKGENITTLNNSGYQSYTNWAKNISPGNLENQEVFFQLLIDNTSIFSSIPTITSNGNLTYSTNPENFGTSLLTIMLKDSGDISNGGCNTSVIETFTISTLDIYDLFINMQGMGKVLIDGIEEQNNLQFEHGRKVELQAYPDEGWIFAYWRGDIIDTENPLVIEMDSHKRISAYFVKDLPVNLNISGQGWVKINNELCRLPSISTFEPGSDVIIEAVPDNNFHSFSGDISSDLNPLKFQIHNDMDIKANFIESDFWKISFSAFNEDSNDSDISEIEIGVMPEEKLEEFQSNMIYPCQILIFNQELEKFSKDIRQADLKEYKWIIAVKPNGNIGDPLLEKTTTIKWQPYLFSQKGFYQLKKGFDGNGEIIISDMRSIDKFDVKGINSFKYFTLHWITYESYFDYNLMKGWNLISLPVIPDNTNVESIFKNVEVTYGFDDGSYINIDNIENGSGYWVKMNKTTSFRIYGANIKSKQLYLTKGWHLIGGISTLSEAQTEPENSISIIYYYDDGAYHQADKFEPGFGYWVNAVEDCTLILK